MSPPTPFLKVESVVEVEMKFQVWKQKPKSKGLKVNLVKTRVLISRKTDKTLLPTQNWPYSICRKGVKEGIPYGVLSASDGPSLHFSNFGTVQLP